MGKSHFFNVRNKALRYFLVTVIQFFIMFFRTDPAGKVYAKNKPHWKEIFNSDAKKYWGTGDVLNLDIQVEMVNKKERIFELNIHLPALGGIILK